MIPVRDSEHDSDIMRNMVEPLFVRVIDSKRTKQFAFYL